MIRRANLARIVSYLAGPCSLLAAAAALSAPRAHCAEIHSAGRGGGDWSASATWHGGRIPRADDDVVIAMRDHVVFDVADRQEPSCKNLYIDPEGLLSFKSAAGDYTLCVGQIVESYGAIKIDRSRARAGHCELRLLTKTGRTSEIRLLENSSILVYGHAAVPAPNVRIAARAEDGQSLPVRLVAARNAMVDIQRAALAGVVVQLAQLDNTGARPNERLNLIGNRLEGLSRIELDRCDTPAVRDNRIDRGKAPAGDNAILVQSSSLAELRGNQVLGPYAHGIYVYNDTGSVIAGNRVDGSTIGIEWHGSNGVVKQNAIERCATGLALSAGTAAVEQVSVEKAQTAFQVSGSITHQLTSCRVGALQPGGTALALDAASITLLNCNIGHDQIKPGSAPAGGLPYVQTMEYLVVQLREKNVSRKWVEVRTAAASGGVPATGADLNVRNSPATVDGDRRTPLPATTRALVVRSWKLAADKSRSSAPFYDLVVMAPADQPGGALKQIHTQMVEPNETWFRDDPQSGRATVEVTVP